MRALVSFLYTLLALAIGAVSTLAQHADHGGLWGPPLADGLLLAALVRVVIALSLE